MICGFRALIVNNNPAGAAMGMRIGSWCALALCLATPIVVTADLAEEQAADRIKDLERRVAELESKQQPATSHPRDLETVIRAVMQDAQRRSDPIGPLLPDSAGHDGSFFVRSGDGKFSL